MKTHFSLKRLVAFALVFAMLFSMIACSRPVKTTLSVDNGANALLDRDEYTREEMELIVDLLGNGESTEDMTDEELRDLVDKIVESNGGNSEDFRNLSATVNKDKITVDLSGKDEFYNEDGEIKIPFDQIYPELIEKDEVEYSDESLLVKLSDATLTEGLRAAGVAALDELFSLEDCAWYEAKLAAGTDAKKALNELRALREVLIAEYNYEVKTAAIDDYKHFDKEKDEEFKKNGHNKDQWHFHYVGIPDGYEEMENDGGLPSTVVAVIDTGVDYDHEDLKDNMWYNAGEIPDNGRDDDGNGYVDDYYGVDLIAKKGNGDDDNGHGTHVAGIIAARNNNVGVLGIAYNTKIMPIKAAMHNGTLNQADIARAVLYAYEMGAEVINMSFGGTACTIAVQDALAVAYTRCVLVASAGNNGAPNQGMFAIPNYPAALTYVLGVMSVDQNGVESAFTNWDVLKYNGVEYELYAPGESIMSTMPNDEYGFLSGTSMAAPIVSGMAAILRSEFADRDMYPTKFIYGQLACTSDYFADCIDPKAHGLHNLPQVVNLEAALTKLPKPEVNLQNFAIFDSVELSEKNNGDGVIDAGETIALGLTLRNRWGMSENTVVTVDTLENGISDPYVTIVNPEVNYGSVGTYSTGDCGKIMTDGLHTGWEDPFIIKIADDCPNDYRMTFHVTVECENALDEEDTTVYTSYGDVDLTARHGVILPSIIDEDMVLTKDNLYIIPNATVIQEGVTVRVEAGTNIQFWSDDPSDPYAADYIAYLLVNGKFLVEGTKEEPVMIYPSQLMDHYGVEIGASSTGYVSLEYADVTNFFYDYYHDHTGTYNRINFADHCTFRFNYGEYFYSKYLSSGQVEKGSTSSPYLGYINAQSCVFYKIGSSYNSVHLGGKADRCIFVDCGIDFKGYSLPACSAQNCVFLGNCFVDQTEPNRYTTMSNTIPNDYDYRAKVEKVCYREETGTTYVSVTGTVYNFQLLREKYGLDYAVIETPEELEWLKKSDLYTNSYSYYVGIYRDGERFVWSDGSEILPFADPHGELTPDYSTHSLYVYNFSNSNWTKGKSGRSLFEIPGHILPTEISFEEYSVRIDTGATYQLSPANLPIQLPLDAFIYESTDESVVTVSDTGLVTPVGEGSADVYVYSLDRAVKNYVTFNVVDYVPLENISFKETEITVAEGNIIATNCVLTPENTTRSNVTYFSDNEDVATVDNHGVITAIRCGTANITASCEGLTATLPVKVCVKVESITFDEVSVDIDTGAVYQLSPISSPTPLSYDTFIYESTDESVVKVSDTGLVTPVGAGSAAIYVYSLDRAVGNYVSFNIVDYVPLENISFAETELIIAKGESTRAGCVFTPENTTRKNVTYSSDNESVATVDKAGNVTAVGKGTANITAECEGMTVTIPVTVYIRVTFIDFARDTIVASLEDEIMEIPAALFDEGAEPELIWRSTDESVAQITDGKIKLLSTGTTTIVVKDKQSDLTASFALFVFDKLENTAVKDIQTNASYHLVLFENGNLYYWNNTSPKLIETNVKLISLSPDTNDYRYVTVNDEDIIKYRSGETTVGSTIESFKGQNIVDIEYCYSYNSSNIYVMTENGNAYSWGNNNNNGQLGLGTNQNTTESTLINLDGIVDIEAHSNQAFFLVGNGDLYVTSGSSNNYQPLKIDTDVQKLLYNTYYSGCCYLTYDGVIKRYNHSIETVKTPDLSDMDLVVSDDYVDNGVAIKDGRAYRFDRSTMAFELIPEITNAVSAYSSYDAIYIMTSDNKLYGYGKNGASSKTNHFTSLYKGDNYSVPVQIPFPSSPIPTEDVFVTGSNLNDGVISGKDLLLNFNKKISTASPKLYADGVQVTCNYEIYDENFIRVNRFAGFSDGVKYELVFEASGVRGFNDTVNSKEIRIGFTFGKQEIIVDVADSYQLSPYNAPGQLPADLLIYESSDISILKVSSTGIVTPKEKGSAYVYVSTKSGALINCITVNVVDYVPLEDIVLSKDTQELGYGANLEVSYELVPSNTTRRNVKISSSDESVVSVDANGKLTAVGFGEAVITVEAEGITRQMSVTVCLNSISFKSEVVEVAKGESSRLEFVTDPVNTSTDIFTYSSSDESIFTVDAAGNITGIKEGTATITAYAMGLETSATVIVYNKATSMDFVQDAYTHSLDSEPIDLTTFGIRFSTNDDDPDLEWSVEDTDIAKIEDCKLVAVSIGTTLLTATDRRSGLRASLIIYVTEEAIATPVAIYPGRYYTSYNSRYDFMVLLEDGTLYEVKSDEINGMTKTILYENVKDFDRDGDVHMVLFEDGTVELHDEELDGNYSYIAKEYDYFKDLNPVGVACAKGQYFVYTEDGDAYSWGYNNDSYQLGRDYTNDTPEKIEDLYWVSDIITIKELTLIQAGDGLYMLGGSFLQCLEPKRIAANADVMMKSYNGQEEITSIVYATQDWNMYRFSYDASAPVKIKDGADYSDILDSLGEDNKGIMFSYESFYNVQLKRFEQYNCATIVEINENGWYDYATVKKTKDVAALCYDGNYYWAISADGTVYQLDDSSKIITTFPLADNGEPCAEYNLVSTNLSEDNVLSDDKLILNFDRAVYVANGIESTYNTGILLFRSIGSSSYWSSYSVYVSRVGNSVILTMPYGSAFRTGYEYKLNIDPNWIKGSNNAIGGSVDVYFTYEKPQAVATTSTEAPVVLMSVPTTYEMSGATVTSSEKVIHESVLDTSIQRIPTVESIQSELDALQKKYQFNDSFYGNAILNPISTVTNVEKWFRPVASEVTAGTYTEIPLGGNYWGTTNERAIELQMVDYTDYITYARLMYSEYLTEAPENTFPFVTSVKLFNEFGEEVTTVGNEKITFRVTFNRDMDTSIPLLVRFGSAYPYGDYEIEGSYVDARTWEGTYTLNTLIENGMQYFTISNGCSATEDLELQTDRMRFGFEIDTTAAQALIMQGTATDTGIELKWTQDDFDTLMGYNVYRSDKEDGLYVRLNKTVIPADTMTFFDDTVEPGKVYYYNFTVVKTDLTESEPSGKITIMSKDTMAPDIYHSPVSGAFTGSNLVVSATVTDNLHIAYANLYYRAVGDSEWKIIRMNSLNDKYSAIILASDVTVAGIEYYIEAFDGVSFTYKGSEDMPFVISIQEAISADALGDVNGDGSITNLDALLLLYAINDKYNLTQEEFARADLNGDGELWAAEALRILQYVNGTVGSVKMS